MKKRLIFALTLVLALGYSYLYYSNGFMHKPIDSSDVVSVRIVGGHKKPRLLKEEQAKKIVLWFNKANSIRRNVRFAGTTPDTTIVMYIKGNNRILIMNSGEDFEVQREIEGKNLSYWAKQPDISELLDALEAGKNINI